ncbi:hypothetical protein JG687_00007559 [Phytophthora cactorum]|uniref:Uncharacterized protein n=1 Tax=Phytophthora cactorum TaxID=29920 RepID=A0A8T1UH41_9STRA|nr:hypothetical protein JG687_00007559 [Phytophthora cactorum]
MIAMLSQAIINIAAIYILLLNIFTFTASNVMLVETKLCEWPLVVRTDEDPVSPSCVGPSTSSPSFSRSSYWKCWRTVKLKHLDFYELKYWSYVAIQSAQTLKRTSVPLETRILECSERLCYGRLQIFTRPHCVEEATDDSDRLGLCYTCAAAPARWLLRHSTYDILDRILPYGHVSHSQKIGSFRSLGSFVAIGEGS